MAEELLLTRYERGLNLHDHRECAHCFAVNGVREFRMARPWGDGGAPPPPLHGREAIARDLRALMTALPDIAVEVVSAGYGSDRRLWTEWRVRGTHALRGGGRIDVLGVSVFRLSNEGFLEERLYWDSAFCAQPPRDAGAS